MIAYVICATVLATIAVFLLPERRRTGYLLLAMAAALAGIAVAGHHGLGIFGLWLP